MTSATSVPNSKALDRQTAVRLGRVIRTFASSELGGRAGLLAGVLIALLLAINGLNVVNSYVGRDFMTAIEHRDREGFFDQALLYAAVFVLSTIAAVVYRFTEERLGLLWREWFTRRLTARYLERHFYYDLNAAEGGLANPDQRIADDVRSFTTTTLSLALVFLNGTLTVIAFSGVLWSISRPLFATAVIYAALGSAVAYFVGRPLVRLNYDQSDREADFRARLVHIRENAESIALLGWEPPLRVQLFDQIGAFTANFRRIIAVNRNLGFFTTGYNYMIQLIPALVVAPLFISGSAEFGVIPQSAMAFAQLIGAFSLVVNQFPQLSSYAAVLARLSALGEAHETLTERGAGDVAIIEDDSRFAVDRLTLLAPQESRPLVRDLSLEVLAGERVLVAANNDLVSSALLRAVAGLSRTGSGRVVRPRREQMFLVPERPYLPPVTLRDLLRDWAAQPTVETRIWEMLRLVGADAAVRRAGGLDVQRDWNGVLAPDEQRLVCAARVLLASPQFAVLAHPATGLGRERASQVLAALGERGVGCLVLDDGALGHEQYHTVVEIAADGMWKQTGARQPPL